MRQARELWIGRRKRFFNKALARLIFIDETSTNTKLTKRTGWAPKGERFRTHAPFGKWQTQTFIAGLRCHGLVALWIVNGPMNGAIFERYVETQLAPELSAGDVVILDDIGFHKNGRAAQLVRQKGAWLLFLPPYSPDLSPSRWPTQNSRRGCERRRPEPSMHSARRSAISASCSSQLNAETSSKLLDMKPINHDTFLVFAFGLVSYRSCVTNLTAVGAASYSAKFRRRAHRR
ncbi:transposase [Mesorhizobium shangrilense]|uniref:Transposase n=1 Tax=Mesorhizobium shangrilense TaxID=460060 RepID=A0ABV2DGV6_9HYPH